MDHLFEVMMIVNAGMKRNRLKAREWSEKLAKNLEEEGDEKAAARIRRAISGESQWIRLCSRDDSVRYRTMLDKVREASVRLFWGVAVVALLITASMALMYVLLWMSSGFRPNWPLW